MLFAGRLSSSTATIIHFLYWPGAPAGFKPCSYRPFAPSHRFLLLWAACRAALSLPLSLSSLPVLVSLFPPQRRRIMSLSLLNTSAPVPPICIPLPSAALRQPAPSILIKVPPARMQSEVTNISVDSCLKQESHSQKKERKKKQFHQLRCGWREESGNELICRCEGW